MIVLFSQEDRDDHYSVVWSGGDKVIGQLFKREWPKPFPGKIIWVELGT